MHSYNFTEEATSVVKLLIDNGANVDAVDIYGMTPLHYAAMRGNDVAARDLLTYDIVNIEVRTILKLLLLNAKKFNTKSVRNLQEFCNDVPPTQCIKTHIQKTNPAPED